MKSKNTCLSIIGFIVVFASSTNTASAGLFDKLQNYVEKEVIPTLKGDRPLRIDPERITVNYEGKKVFEVDQANDSAFIRFGDAATLKTGKLKQRIAEAGAIYAGDYTVLSKVAAEQFKKELADVDAHVSYTPPPNLISQEVPAEVLTPQTNGGKKVVIYNITGGKVNYILNNRIYTVEHENGIEHTSGKGEYYLQFDEATAPNQLIIGRYFLHNSDSYIFEVSNGKIQIRPI
jgi:hypothetical protein